MKRNFNKSIYLIALFLVIGAGMAGAQQQNQSGSSPQGQVSDLEEIDLVFMREEEKLARDTYLGFSEQWGLTIFSNIAKSEQRHMDALEVLLDAFGIVDPVTDELEVGTFSDSTLQDLFDYLTIPGPQSEMDALKVGGAIEEIDILDIQDAIDHAENLDIITTYENLLCGSRNHLRAFVRQIELNGEVYTPIELTTDELDAIVNFPMERGCGTKRQGGGNGAGNGSGDGSGTCTQPKGGVCG